MDSRLVRIFCANLPSQKARGESYNLLLSLIKVYLFRHRSWCYRLSSSSTSPESIKSQEEKRRIAQISANGFALICAIRRFLFRILTDHDKRSAANLMALCSLGVAQGSNLRQ